MFPSFYNPQNVGTFITPQTLQAVNAGYEAGLEPASEDQHRVLLLLVDPQIDFIHTDGALSVPGAVEDTRRTVEWLYRNAGKITNIAASLDSHVPRQIFFPTWWVDGNGNHPAPFTPITAAEVDAGRWIPVIERTWSVEYVHRLEAQAKKVLMIWSYHTLIGTPGHAITPALYEAIAYHTAARKCQPHFLSKGSVPKTEHYSIMEPEVKVHGDPMGGLNTQFLDLVGSYDEIYVAGQAKSHCVLETLTSMVNYYAHSPATLRKIHVLSDCTSSVYHPEIDFEGMANAKLAEYAEQGLTLIQSTETDL